MAETLRSAIFGLFTRQYSYRDDDPEIEAWAGPCRNMKWRPDRRRLFFMMM
jgi:hypothetical protein